VKYDRNFNISAGENLPCLTQVTNSPKQKISDVKALAVTDPLGNGELSNDRYLGITKEMGTDPCDFSYSKMFYIPPPQSSKAEDQQTI